MYIGFACMALCLYNIYYYPCRSRQKKLRICLLLTWVRRTLPTLQYRPWSLLRSCLPQLWPQLRHCPQLRCSHLRHCWPLLCWLQLCHCSTGLSSATAPSSTCATAGPCSAGPRSACPSSTAGPCSAAPTCATAGPSPMGNMAPSVLGASRSSAV